MSLHSPTQIHPLMLPVSAAAEPLQAFYLTTEMFRPAGLKANPGDRQNEQNIEPLSLHEAIIRKLMSQPILPLLSPKGYLEGVLTDFSLLGHHVLDDLPDGLADHMRKPTLNLPRLLQESRRAMVCLQSSQTLQDAQALLYATQYPYIPVVDEAGLYSGTAVSRARLLALITTRSTPEAVEGGMSVKQDLHKIFRKLSLQKLLERLSLPFGK